MKVSAVEALQLSISGNEFDIEKYTQPA